MFNERTSTRSITNRSCSQCWYLICSSMHHLSWVTINKFSVCTISKRKLLHHNFGLFRIDVRFIGIIEDIIYQSYSSDIRIVFIRIMSMFHTMYVIRNRLVCQFIKQNSFLQIFFFYYLWVLTFIFDFHVYRGIKGWWFNGFYWIINLL